MTTLNAGAIDWITKGVAGGSYGTCGTVIAAIISVLSVPVILLNFGGGIVGGIWLLVLGNWGLLGLGLLSMFVSSFGLGLALAPGLLFSAPAALALQRQRYVIGSLCALLGNLYTFVVMTVWCVGCFYVVFHSYYRGGSIWPYLLGRTVWRRGRGPIWLPEKVKTASDQT